MSPVIHWLGTIILVTAVMANDDGLAFGWVIFMQAISLLLYIIAYHHERGRP